MSGPIDTTNGVEPVELDAVVIGTGFAGLCALHVLRNDLGLEVRAFDDAPPGVGGTWYWNCYPGARADTEVTAYCYSFDRDLFDTWRWSERYPRQPEILAYLNHVADRFDLRRSITLETRVLSATFDEHVNRWIVVTDGGERLAARFLIEASACSRRRTRRPSPPVRRPSPARSSTPRAGRSPERVSRANVSASSVPGPAASR